MVSQPAASDPKDQSFFVGTFVIRLYPVHIFFYFLPTFLGAEVPLSCSPPCKHCHVLCLCDSFAMLSLAHDHQVRAVQSKRAHHSPHHLRSRLVPICPIAISPKTPLAIWVNVALSSCCGFRRGVKIEKGRQRRFREASRDAAAPPGYVSPQYEIIRHESPEIALPDSLAIHPILVCTPL